MDLGMQGKKAMVTGASAGIGKAVTRTLAREGVDVAICARRKEPLEAAAAEIAKETGRKIVPIAADLTKAGGRGKVRQAGACRARPHRHPRQQCRARRPGGVIEHLSEEEWASALQLKFMGYVRCMKHVLPIMQKQRKGRVVNVIGNDGVKVSYWEIAPGAANAAGQNLTVSLASQYGKDNISFVAVNPGPVRTERWTGLVHAMARDMNLSLRGGGQARACEHSAGPHRRIGGGRQPRDVSCLRPRVLRQRHDDRDRRRPGEIADGPHARQVTDISYQLSVIRKMRKRNAVSRPLISDF